METVKTLKLRIKDKHAKVLLASECGATHDRDTNAAKNILAAGLRRLEEEIPALWGGEEVNAAEQEAAQNAITQAEIVRLSLADQECFAKALLNPSEPMQALTRAFAHRDKLLSTEA